jgi:hypothetical protein
MTIANRIQAALKHFVAGEFEDALLQVSSALEGTAKKQYPSVVKSPDRCKQFIRDNEEFLLWYGWGGMFRVGQAGQVTLHTTLAGPKFDEWVYGILRCGMYHEASVGDTVFFTDQLIAYGTLDGGKYVVPVYLVLGMILAVIGAPANADQSVKGGLMLPLDDGTMPI